MPGPVSICLATEGDLLAIRDIYNHYVLTSTCTYQLEPDTEAERLAWFHGRTERHPAIVAEVDREVVGWGSLSPHKQRAGYARTVEASVYIRDGHQRRGLGKRLLLDLIKRAQTLGHHVVIGGACTQHPGSIALQLSVGFQSVGTFRQVGYKFGRWLDVEYLQLILPERES
jgi:phosphinothricin acetyltransferase